MKRSTSNILTVVLAFVVLLAGVMFAFYILPIITEDPEGHIDTFSAEVNTPQEIIRKPTQALACTEFFPFSFSNHKLEDSEALDENAVRSRKSFLDRLSNQVDILFNVKIDSIILEKYAQVWRYLDSSETSIDEIRNQDDLFFIDVLFTDAKLVQWRITAAGYADSIFYLSCLESGSPLSTPLFPTKMAQTPSIAVPDERMVNAISRFRSKLYSTDLFPTLFSVESSFQQLEICLYDPNSADVYWMLHLESDGRYLLSAYSKVGNMPICYAYLNLQQETGSYTDIFWDLYNK